MYQSIRSFFEKGHRAVWCVFLLFALTTFVKVTLFHWICFHTLMVSSLWKAPSVFWAFWLPKLSIATLIGSFIFLTKRKYWTIIVSVIIDLWIIANLIYFRSNNLFISYEAVEMASNLQGFESSILTYFTPKALYFPLLTLLYSLTIPLWTNRKSLISFLIVLIPSIAIFVYDMTTIAKHVKMDSEWLGLSFLLPENYVYEYSIVEYVPIAIEVHHLETNTMERRRKQSEQMHIYDRHLDEQMRPYINPAKENLTPRYNMLFILVESLESWVMDLTDKNGRWVAPNLHQLAHSESGMYCSQICSQVREGVSGDGQMICHTGILPLRQGAACIIFGDNTYPSWTHLYDNTLTICPNAGQVWNQKQISESYGYKHLICPTGKRDSWNDDIITDSLLMVLDTISASPFCIQTITISMHTPFSAHNYGILEFDESIPTLIQDYLHCVHYTDSCIGKVIRYIRDEPKLANTMLVVTGDHTILKPMMLRESQAVFEAHNIPISDGKNYVPLIINCPAFKENTEISEVGYQMDIYPTIMSLLGCEDYYWKGLGVNLSDSVSRRARLCTEDDAYLLSDKLIRSNYFLHISNP